MNDLPVDSREPSSVTDDVTGRASRPSSNASLDRSRRGTVVLIGLGCFCILTLSLTPPDSNPLIAGLAWGTLFGHFVAAGFVLATRRDSLTQRLGVAFVWLTTLDLYFFLAASRDASNANDVGIFSIVVAIVGWVASTVTVLALRAVRRLFGLHVAREMLDDAIATERSQFSLRQLLLLTTVVAVMLAIGRALVQPLLEADEFSRHVPSTAILALLALATVLTQIPNWLALLSPRWWGGALTITLVLTAAVVAAEWALVAAIVPRGMRGDLHWVLASINAFATGWVLAFAAVFRRAGYRLARRSPTSATLGRPDNVQPDTPPES